MTISPVLIGAVLVGRAMPLRGLELSAIRKVATSGPVNVTRLGLAGDEQADLAVHGGPDKAVHHYAFDHYSFWLAKAPGHPRLHVPGAFGENISTQGLTEESVCIGDTFRMGTALVEVSQPRQPCWKQAHVMEWTTLPKMMVRERKSGWYYRVIEDGCVAANDWMTLISRPNPEWTVARVFALLIGGEGRSDRAACRALADLPVLEAGWRQIAAARADVQ
jgi:MOSC domain-containing protein YiiM